MSHRIRPGRRNNSAREVPFARPSIGEAEKQAVLEVLDSGWLTTGQQAAAFETEFAAAIGSDHALAVSSATAGLHLALEAFGVSSEDRVAVTPYTFASSAEVIRYLGGEPVFVDIERNSPNISPEAFEGTLAADRNRRIAAVIPVHIGGLACRMADIRSCAARYAVHVVEDAAHAFPAWAHDGTMVGATGTAVFSFYANKPITTGEGGMVATDSPEIAERIRHMRLHGIDRPVWDRYRHPGAGWEYDLVAAGYKYNLPDILAAIGRRQLERASQLLERRCTIAADYLHTLSMLPEVLLPTDAQGHAWHLFTIQVDERVRDAVIAGLAERGVGTSVHYKPLHLMKYYRDRYGLKADDFPNATERFGRSLSLPLYPDMDSDDRRYVVESLKQVLFECSAPRLQERS